MNQISNIGRSQTRPPETPGAFSLADSPERSSPAQGVILRGPAAGAGSPAPTGVMHAPAAGSKPTIEERVAQARANPAKGKVYAFYAAALAFEQGLPIESCPFDAKSEAQLRAEWLWFYGIQANAAHRARPATPPAEFRNAARRKYVPPKSKPVQTTSAAYAEQLGVEPKEGEQ